MGCFDDPKEDPRYGKCGCTDLICLSIFSVFIAVMLCIFFDVWDPFNSVKLCVRQCPDRKLETFDDLKAFTKHTACSLCYDLAMSQYEKGVFYMDEKWQFVCPNFPVYQSVSVFRRCIPKSTRDISAKLIYSIHSYLNNIEFLQQLFTDFYKSWVTMAWLITLGVGISLCTILSFHYYAYIVSWTILIASSLAAIVFTIILWVTFVNIEHELDDTPREEQLDKMLRNEIAFLIYSILATIITIIIIIIAVFMRKKIKLMIDLFKTASKCFQTIPCLFSQPLWTCCALTIFLIFWISVMLSLATANRSSLIKTDHHHHHHHHSGKDLTTNKTFTHLPVMFPSFQFEDPTWVQSMWWYYVIAFIWICEFILAFQQMVIAGAVSRWYFTRHVDDLKSWPILNSFRKVLFFHIGSLAIGSFLITIFKLPRLLLTFIDNRMKKETPEWCRGCVKCCGICCWCCLHALEKFIRYMNHNAYTIVVWRRTNFCCSAKRAYDILSAHILEIAVLDKAGDCILFFGKCFVTIVVGIIGLLVMQNDPELYFYAGPLLVVCVFTYFIAHCFFSIYEMVIDTLFLCLCEDYYHKTDEDGLAFAKGSLEVKYF
uniref:Choline transporter-like protein n=1 Tax=Strigamia maritima TaxID=126957 RepID=T1J1K1_STRMM